MSSNGEGVKNVVKEKKSKTAKTASHPPYFQMIKEAISALKEKGGSSPHAIAKYMEDNHKAVLPENFRKILANQLKNSASKGKLIKVKASFKLSESSNKENAAPAAGVKKTTVASKKSKPAATATGTTGKPKKAIKAPKKPAKTAAVKKMTPSKVKLPKSIKSPAAKKAKKATA